jgi:hypothetical protein
MFRTICHYPKLQCNRVNLSQKWRYHGYALLLQKYSLVGCISMEYLTF